MLIEPYKSAQHYIEWNRYGSSAASFGEKVFYKYVKTGWFSGVLYTWDNNLSPPAWRTSSHKKVPKRLALQGVVFKVTDANRELLQQEDQMSDEDRAWAEEQRQFIAKKEAKRAQIAQKDRERRQVLENNKTGQLIDRLIERNRKKK